MIKFHPLIFSAPMVRAIIEGRKTQTRRVTKLKFSVGQRLWVKENCWIAPVGFGDQEFCNCTDADGNRRVVGYSASMDGDSVRCAKDYGVRQTPSLFMPRWASRLTLEVTGLYEQQLQKITESDARAEGVENREQFVRLWDAINDKPGIRWADDPLVRVITFRVVNK